MFIAVGVFLIALVSLWMVYSQQAGVKNQLKEELALVNTRLGSIQIEQLSTQQGELEQKLDETIRESESARETLSQPMNGIIISDVLFQTAQANSVNITEINSPGMSGEELAGVPCLSLPLTTTIEGELPNLVAFITQLNSDLDTGYISSLDLNIKEPKSFASIKLVVYTHKES